MKKQTKTILIAIIVLIGGSFLTLTSANASVPGDMLYGIDRSFESIQRTLQISPEAQAEFEVALLKERTEELSLLEKNNSGLDLIVGAVDNLKEQDENVQIRLRKSEENKNSDFGEMERIRTRFELQQTENLQLMETMQEKYQIEIKNEITIQEQGQLELKIDDEQAQPGENQNDNPQTEELDQAVENNFNNTNDGTQQSSGNNPN